MASSEELREYVKSKWDREYAYTTRDVADLLSTDTRNARHFLLKLVDDGTLGQLKYWNKTYYVMREQAELFRRFEFVRVI